MKQVQLAKKLGISKSYMSMVLSGKRRLKPALLCELSSQEMRDFEAISSLRGRCPRPLDECATKHSLQMAGEEGFEPSHTDSESAVLPLDDSPAPRRL